MAKVIFEYARLLRLAGLGALSFGPVFGAISLINIGVKVDLLDLSLLLLIGVLANIFGFVSNDYADIEIDKLSKEPVKRPLVTGVISKKTAIGICALCVIFIFGTIFIFFYKNQLSFVLGLLCIIVAFILVYIYNMYSKKIIGSDFLIAISGALFSLFGAYIITKDGTLSIFTYAVLICEFSQFLFGNAVAGGLKDSDHDYLGNVKNLASFFGVKVIKDKDLIITLRFKMFGIGLRFIFVIGIFIPFIYGIYYKIWEILLLIVFGGALLLISTFLLSIKKIEDRKKIVKLGGIMGILRYSMIPLMFLPVIGLFYVFILIISPVVWYIIFTPISGKKLFQQVM